jgi:hypothetical protein
MEDLFARLATITLLSVTAFLAGWAVGERWATFADTPVWFRISAAVVAGLTGICLKAGWIR